MTDIQLTQAQQAREDRLLAQEIDTRLGVILSHADVSPSEREALGKLLSHYAKSPTPFRACVRDNMKRFGPGRTERVCATVKDMIRGTHRWRSGDGVAASNDAPELTPEVETLLLSIPDEKLEALFMEVSRA